MKYFKITGADLFVKSGEVLLTNVLTCSEIGLYRVLEKIPVGSSISIECLVDSSSCDKQDFDFD